MDAGLFISSCPKRSSVKNGDSPPRGNDKNPEKSLSSFPGLSGEITVVHNRNQTTYIGLDESSPYRVS
jgi:hypothetical protein